MKDKKNLFKMLVNIHNHKYLLSLIIVITMSAQVQSQTWSLQRCIDSALVHNKSLQIGRNNMVLVDQKRKEAAANLIPKVNIVGDYKYFTDLPYQLMPLTTFNPTATEGQFKEAQFGVPHNINASIQVAMPLYNAQIYGGIRNARIAFDISELQYRKSEEQVYFEISSLYYSYQILSHQLAFADSNIINTARLLENVQLLHQHQMIKETDVKKVELQKAQLITQREVILNNIDQVMSTLKLSMGISTNESIRPDPEIRLTSIGEYKNSPTIELLLTNTQNLFLTSELKTLKNLRLPSVSLYGSYGQAGFGYDKTPNEFLKFFPVSFVGIQFTYPLFNGTITHRKINQKKIEIQNNELQIGMVAEQNQIQIEAAGRRRAVMETTIANTYNQATLARTVHKQTILQQKEGTANLADVLLADNALREAQQNYLSALVEFLRADLDLKRLTGNITIIN